MNENGVESSETVTVQVTAAAHVGSGFPQKWPEEIIESAYQIWCSTAGRNDSEACRQLAAAHGVGVQRTTLAKWRTSRGWQQRAAADSLDATQIWPERFIRNLWVAAPSAVNFLRSVAEGTAQLQLPTEDNPSPPSLDQRIRAAQTIEAAARSLLLKQADVDKGDRRQRPVVPASQPVPLSTMNSDELEAEEQRRRTARQQRDS